MSVSDNFSESKSAQFGVGAAALGVVVEVGSQVAIPAVITNGVAAAVGVTKAMEAGYAVAGIVTGVVSAPALIAFGVGLAVVSLIAMAIKKQKK